MPGDKLNGVRRGARSELLAALDLMNRGDEVFRAMSPSASCDLLILRNGKPLRVEVKTGRKAKSGDGYSFGSINQTYFDLLAVVVGDQVIYNPERTGYSRKRQRDEEADHG